MWGASNMLLGVVLLVCGVGKGVSYGAPLQTQFPLGTVGCLYTKHLCKIEEDCVDDFLFGNCQRLGLKKDNYKYHLDSKSLGSLVNYAWYLFKKGYSWRDEFTQCILQNALVSYRQQTSFEPSICRTGTIDSNVGDEISSVLERLFQQYYNAYRPSTKNDNFAGSRSHKRDEIVHVHKYFDKSPEPYIKRDWIPDSAGQNYINYLSSGSDSDSYNAFRSPNNLDIQDESLTLDDLQTLQSYLQRLKSSQDSDAYSDFGLPSFDTQEYDAPISNTDVYEPVQDATSESNSPFEWSNDKVENVGPELPSDAELPPLSTPYAEMLTQLMYGDLKPENLTEEQLDFLSDYVTTRLRQMGFTEDEIQAIQLKPPSQEDAQFIPNVSESPSMELLMDDSPSTEVLQEDSPSTELLVNNDPSTEILMENSPAQNILEAKPDDDDQMREIEEIVDNPTQEVVEEELDDKNNNKRVLGIPVVNPLSAEKKNVDMPSAEAVENKDMINTNYAYVDVSQHLNKEQTNRLLSILEEKLEVPQGSFNPVKDFGNRVTFYVNEAEIKMNASTVANKVDELKKDIKEFTILDTGIGYNNTVAFKPRDDRYFVLTFVLCGCIAGILLAVVVIYLIRRYSRSKEKLAQLSSTGDNTEASKDYQDLCRQRMQGKSSEKPEPLHAASRIGSVSESQVRSPSSRSSTSSWSEEPVVSNMDISTGHIVLSYMEDHLKNKDRLDREWEALCAYEADPSNTKVASDSTNMRKNRYSDILPYDHSRVVMSNASNVSGSDYINASSITDHDPRNPAYIATQGPLPHTIADFWQMVWEQGSVVIVMLTKLTENGEAMCHRYWPEEGSDLYHIYEVHLVSEHIWCDDYLVRSFYLKNLQTNETRTVTMFHFLTWPDLGAPSSIKALLDFRRKVNKSYRGRSCPIVVHCSDGCGRTGTYCLIDMVLNRMAKGAKEIDIAATLEHIRDQRMDMVKTKDQFQFVLAAVAEEVHAILKALPQ